jgi:hypothetical protein
LQSVRHRIAAGQSFVRRCEAFRLKFAQKICKMQICDALCNDLSQGGSEIQPQEEHFCANQAGADFAWTPLPRLIFGWVTQRNPDCAFGLNVRLTPNRGKSGSGRTLAQASGAPCGRCINPVGAAAGGVPARCQQAYGNLPYAARDHVRVNSGDSEPV